MQEKLTNNAEKEKYGPLFYDESKVFHGVGVNFGRVKSILENGILSEQEARARGIQIARNYGGYNFGNNISVVESPSVNNSFDFGAFRLYVKDGGISFAIEDTEKFKAIPGSSEDSGFVDEAFVSQKIEREKIVGIIIPEGFLEKPISQLELGLGHLGHGYIFTVCMDMLDSIERETGYSDSIEPMEKLFDTKEVIASEGTYSSDRQEALQDIIIQIDNWMTHYLEQAYAQKLGIEAPTFRDVLKLYIPKDMKVYNTEGWEIEL